MLENTATHIYCQTCGSAWELADATGYHYFRSASFPIGSYASPASIAGAAEEMTFCPSCDVGELAAPYQQPGPGIQESPFYEGDSRMIGSEPDDSPGSDTGSAPDVIHET